MEEGWEENPRRNPVCVFPVISGSWRAGEASLRALFYLLVNDFSADGVELFLRWMNRKWCLSLA